MTKPLSFFLTARTASTTVSKLCSISSLTHMVHFTVLHLGADLGFFYSGSVSTFRTTAGLKFGKNQETNHYVYNKYQKGFAWKTLRFSHGKSFKLGQIISPYPHKGPNWFEALVFYIAVATLCEHTSKLNQEKNMVWFWKKGTLPCSDTNAEWRKKLFRNLPFQNPYKLDFE